MSVLRKTVLTVLVGSGLYAAAVLNGNAAATYTASGVNPATGKALSASVTFDVTNSTELVVSVSNFGAPIYAASDVLTGFFFDLNGVGTLTPVSATLATGSVLVNGPTPNKTTLGDFWEYLGGISGPNDATRGISSSGLGIFGKGNFGSNAQKIADVSFGIIDGSPAGGNDHLPTKPFENNTMVFTLNGLPTGFDLSGISKVEFQYGTDLTEPLLIGVPVPEPTSPALLGLAAALLAFRRKL